MKIQVYLDNGLVFVYNVDSLASAREHADAIIRTGYRSCDNDQGVLVHYPPHRIMKVKCSGKGMHTKYPDRIEGT